MLHMLNRARWWLLLRWPSARSVRQGMRDGNLGMTPQLLDNRYYMGGWRRGRAKFVDSINAKSWTGQHDAR